MRMKDEFVVQALNFRTFIVISDNLSIFSTQVITVVHGEQSLDLLWKLR